MRTGHGLRRMCRSVPEPYCVSVEHYDYLPTETLLESTDRCFLYACYGNPHALRFEMIWLSQFERCSAPSASAPEEGSYGCHQTQCWPSRLAILASTESACRAFGISFAPCPV